ncbi:hypothetical protein DY000_02015480 [Brassica cretica]|uniref:DET1- and DDB1-associated protein 1 n=1 Tax=Brassica cretica TaxID=69181 RepID=A0ABQ7CUM4_BRACR|nr:hypothetical protein DY000_02015480 [Brassica cretica]
MTPTESTASCNAVRILTHEEFAPKYPHPLSPDNVRIARRADTFVDRHGESNIARQTEPKLKPSENPPETVRTPSDDGEDPMEEDRVST